MGIENTLKAAILFLFWKDAEIWLVFFCWLFTSKESARWLIQNSGLGCRFLICTTRIWFDLICKWLFNKLGNCPEIAHIHTLQAYVVLHSLAQEELGIIRHPRRKAAQYSREVSLSLADSNLSIPLVSKLTEGHQCQLCPGQSWPHRLSSVTCSGRDMLWSPPVSKHPTFLSCSQ